MTRLANTLQKNTFDSRSPFQPCSAAPAEKDLLEAEKRVTDQEAHVLRLIVQGAPTQSAEDLLRRLMAAAEAMRERRRPARG
ncbi:MAG TPA: hypothetical protein VN524_09195 [Hyphomicrobiaceae bacterium]|nr:hypothetical protein [Hyphomicrobiaceae bacterium]